MPELRYRLPGAEWALELDFKAINYIKSFRQSSYFSKEAGGQLYSPSISTKIVEIRKATGPYIGDRRSRFSYCMGGPVADSDRELNFEAGLHFCGLWHTHPEPTPTPSLTDISTAYSNLVMAKEWNALFVLILGTAELPNGLFVGAIDRTATMRNFERF